MKAAFLTLAAGGLAACTMTAQPPVATPIPIDPGRGDDTCNAAAYQQYVGQRSPQISLPAGTVFRHYRTGDPVTMDLNEARVNFEYSRSGVLRSVTCG